MAIYTVLEPGAINFAYNPIPFKVETDAYLSVEGIAGQYKITFTAGATLPGDVFSITFNNITVTMTAMNAPATLDGLHFRTKSGLETLHAWCDSFAVYLKGNYFINYYFNVVVDPVLNEVYLTAKTPGTHGNISDEDIPGTGALTEIAAGVDQVINANFHLFLKILVFGHTESGNQEIIPLDMLQLNSTEFNIQIQDILQKYVEFDVPQFEIANFATCEKSINFFKLIYYEAYGEPVTPKFLYESDSFTVINGGLNELDFPGNTFFDGYVAPNCKFLTWQKRTKKITKQQDEWLAFLQLSDSAYNRFALKLQIFYDDETDETQYLYDFEWDLETDDGFVYAGMHYFEAGWDYLVSPVAADSNVTKYKVTVVDYTTHNVISETFTFELIEEYSAKTRYFLFGNSLGWFDTLRTTGERVSTLETTGEPLSKFLQSDYAITDGKRDMIRPDATLKFIQRTGWITKAESEYLVELLLSTRAYEIINHELVPIIITRKNTQINAENSKQFALEFEYAYAYDFNAKRAIVTS